MAFTTVTVTRDYDTPGPDPAVGTVSLTPSAQMINGTKTVIAAPIQGTLDGTGTLTLTGVKANTDPGTSPTGTSYLVHELIVGQQSRRYAVVIPHDAGSTVDLGSLAPISVPVVTGAQPLDADLTRIAGLTPANDDVLQRKSGLWTNRTVAQLATDLTAAGLSGGGGAVSSVNTRTGAVTGLAEDSAVVHNTGAEAVAGVKTFSASPVVPTATTSGQAANLGNVTSAVAALVTDLPEATAAARTSADATTANLLGKTTRYDTTGGAITQTLPAATAGRQWAVGWDAGTAALTLTGASRADTCGTTSGSATVTDTSITAADTGRLVTGAGIPAGTYVGTVTPATSFLLSSSSTAQTNVNATATAGSVSLTISDLIGSGTVTSFAVPLSGEVLTAHCTTVGRWRVTSSAKPQTALDGRYAAAGLPTWAGVRLNQFSQPLMAYNWKPSNTRFLRATLGKALSGGSGIIGCIGDSETQGLNAGGPATAWPRRVEAALIAMGYPLRGRYAPGDTTSGDWTASAGTLGPPYTLVTGGRTLTYAPSHTGTVVEVYYFGNTGAITVAIDGGTAVSVTMNGQTAVNTYTVTGLSDTTHSVVLNVTTSAYVVGASVRKTTGLEVNNLGISGSLTTSWSDATTTSPRVISSTIRSTTGCWLVCLGLNDVINSATDATITTNLNTSIDAYQAASADVVLVSQLQPGGTSDSRWGTYMSTLYDIADAQDIPLIDTSALFGTATQANTAGMSAGDGLPHPNAVGHAMVARAVTNCLL